MKWCDTHTQQRERERGEIIPFIFWAPHPCSQCFLSRKCFFITIYDVIQECSRLVCVLQGILHTSFHFSFGELRFFSWYTAMETTRFMTVSNCLCSACQPKLSTYGCGCSKRSIVDDICNCSVMIWFCASRSASSTIMQDVPRYVVALYPSGYGVLWNAKVPSNFAITKAHAM